MQVLVSGKHVAVGEALRERVTDEITGSIGKYFERGGDADVVVSREGHSFRVDCAVKLASGQSLQSHGLGSDAHGAFDAALAKIETRETAKHVEEAHMNGPIKAIHGLDLGKLLGFDAFVSLIEVA